jgi:hypothetical protein
MHLIQLYRDLPEYRECKTLKEMMG